MWKTTFPDALKCFFFSWRMRWGVTLLYVAEQSLISLFSIHYDKSKISKHKKAKLPDDLKIAFLYKECLILKSKAGLVGNETDICTVI